MCDGLKLFPISGCGYGWTQFGSHCYKFIKEHLTWNNAKARCEKEGSNLASVHSLEENQFLSGLAVSSHSFVMLGGNDWAKEGTWVWVDGSVWDYAKWQSGWVAGSAEDCLEMFKDTYWNDVPCDNFWRGAIICKK